MGIILGIVFVIMVVMNGALFYVLYSAVTITKKQVMSCFLKELEDYNGFLEEKERENRILENKKAGLKNEISSLEGVVVSLKTSPFYAPRPVSRELFVPTARYIDNDFFDNHKRVNDMMKSLNKNRIIAKIRESHVYDGNREDYNTACRLLEFLQMDISYELCTVSSEEQLKILTESLSDENLGILGRFLETLGEDEEFDVLNFRTFVKEIRTAQDPKMYIRTGEPDEGVLNTDEDLIYQYDANISEGLKIIYQNQSYDFSIYRLRSRK